MQGSSRSCSHSAGHMSSRVSLLPPCIHCFCRQQLRNIQQNTSTTSLATSPTPSYIHSQRPSFSGVRANPRVALKAQRRQATAYTSTGSWHYLNNLQLHPRQVITVLQRLKQSSGNLTASTTPSSQDLLLHTRLVLRYQEHPATSTAGGQSSAASKTILG